MIKVFCQNCKYCYGKYKKDYICLNQRAMDDRYGDWCDGVININSDCKIL